MMPALDTVSCASLLVCICARPVLGHIQYLHITKSLSILTIA